MTAEEYVEQRVEDQIAWYDRKSSWNQKVFKRLRLAEIAAAASIPLLSGFADVAYVPFFLGLIGALVAVAAGALGLFQFEQHWVEYRTTCESLRKMRFLYLTGTDPFNLDVKENYRLLVQRVESLLSDENTGWAQQLSSAQEEAASE